MFFHLVGWISALSFVLLTNLSACSFITGLYIWCYMFFPHFFWTIFLYTYLNFYMYFRIHLTKYKTQKISKGFEYSEFSRKHLQESPLRKGPFYVLSHHPIHIYRYYISHSLLLVTLFYFFLHDFKKLNERIISYLCILS